MMGPAANCASWLVSPPPPRPPQDHRQPRHGARHRQQLAEALPPSLAVGQIRQHLVHEAVTVAGWEQEGEEAHEAIEDEVFGGLTAEERGTLRRILVRVLDSQARTAPAPTARP